MLSAYVHLKNLQTFAARDLSHSRFIGTDAFRESSDYVAAVMNQAGYQVTKQEVPVDVTMVVSPPLFEMRYPLVKTFINNQDYTPFIGSGSGNVIAAVETPHGKIEGCDAKDFAGFTPGNIALIKRGGSCLAREKVMNAVAAGAKGVMIFHVARPGILLSSLGSPAPAPQVPVLFITNSLGEAMRAAIYMKKKPIVHLAFSTKQKTIKTENIIAESRFGDPNHIIVVGAHLDSTAGSAGMNDNGSAVATTLEVATLMQHVSFKNRVRFIWWTAEEVGRAGSNYYVDHLSWDEKAKISLYLNFEILGAANGARLVLGPDQYGFLPKGSEKITALYQQYFKSQNEKIFVLPPTMKNNVIRSDMAAFVKAGIPVGYILTGAEMQWNPLWKLVFNDLSPRKSGVATHPCYHKACDNLNDDNFDFDLYMQMSQAATYAILTYAMADQPLNS